MAAFPPAFASQRRLVLVVASGVCTWLGTAVLCWTGGIRALREHPLWLWRRAPLREDVRLATLLAAVFLAGLFLGGRSAEMERSAQAAESVSPLVVSPAIQLALPPAAVAVAGVAGTSEDRNRAHVRPTVPSSVPAVAAEPTGNADSDVPAASTISRPQITEPEPGLAPAPELLPPRAPAAALAAAIPMPRPLDGRALPAWLRNAVPEPSFSGRLPVAIVLDDMGIDGDRSRRAVALPGPLTLSFLPYGVETPTIARTARSQGHELLVHVPMQPQGKADPGPHALTLAQGVGGLRSALAWNLSRFEGFVGINNHMGSLLTADPAAMQVVMADLRARGLMFLDSRTSAATVAAEAARRAGVPVAERHVFLDHQPGQAAVFGQLAAVEETARRAGYAIAIGHPHDDTLAALARWLPELSRRGLALVPLTGIVRRLNRGGPVVAASSTAILHRSAAESDLPQRADFGTR